MCTAGLTVAILGDPSQYPAFERSFGRPMAEAVAGLEELRVFEIELAEAARRLGSSVS